MNSSALESESVSGDTEAGAVCWESRSVPPTRLPGPQPYKYSGENRWETRPDPCILAPHRHTHTDGTRYDGGMWGQVLGENGISHVETA